MEAYAALEAQAFVMRPVAFGLEVDVEDLGVEAVEEVVHERGDQPGLRAEVAVHQARNDAGGLRDHGELDVAAGVERDPARDVEQALAGGVALRRRRLDRGSRG